MPLDDPVFLVGCPRSGTTLLQELLDAHPAVAIAPETHFIRRFAPHRADRDPRRRRADYPALIDAVVAMPEFAEMALDPAAYRAAALREPPAAASLLRVLLQQFGAARGAIVVGEKTPNHLLYMRTLERFFPRARFIHIVRDPRAVVLSWQGVPWSTGTIAGDAEVWRRYMETARRRAPASIRTVTYEALVTRPEDVLRSLCTYLGLTMDPAMLAYHTRGESTVNVAREPWKTRARTPLAVERLDRWRRALPSADVRTVEAIVWWEMRRLAYRPETPGLTGLAAATAALLRRRLRRRREKWARHSAERTA